LAGITTQDPLPGGAGVGLLIVQSREQRAESREHGTMAHGRGSKALVTKTAEKTRQPLGIAFLFQ